MKLGFVFSLVQASALAATYPAEASKPSPTPLEKLAGDTQVVSLRALASASDARSAAHEVGARLAAEASARSLQAAAAAGSSIAQRAVTIQNAATAAQQAQAETAAATAQVKAALEAAKASMTKIEASAAKGVSQEVDNKLAGIFKDHQERKMAILHDPAKAAAVAGMKAALPYERAMQTIEKRVSDFETRATGLSNEARGLRVAAENYANDAVKKQAGGALTAAQQTMLNAHTMMNQASQFDAQGQALMKQAQKWNAQIPAYAGASAGAAHAKMEQYAKNLVRRGSGRASVLQEQAGQPEDPLKIAEATEKGSVKITKASEKLRTDAKESVDGLKKMEEWRVDSARMLWSLKDVGQKSKARNEALKGAFGIKDAPPAAAGPGSAPSPAAYAASPLPAH